MLGSISQMAATHCTRSVHIGRASHVAEPSRPVRLVLGYDDSRPIKAVAARNWPAGSEAILLVCAVIIFFRLSGDQVGGRGERLCVSHRYNWPKGQDNRL
ncbi:MAG: hypothetical protein R3E79_06110 [Caldilineaceae bacterium]